MTRSHRTTVPVLGPWSLTTSRTFWEGFTPAALPAGTDTPDRLSTSFLGEADWRPVAVVVEQIEDHAHLELSGDGDLEAAAAQVSRFLALDVDGRGWPEVGTRDPVSAHRRPRCRAYVRAGSSLPTRQPRGACWSSGSA